MGSFKSPEPIHKPDIYKTSASIGRWWKMGESSEAHGPGSLVYIRNDDNSKRGSVLNKTEGKGLLENNKLKKKSKALAFILNSRWSLKKV